MKNLDDCPSSEQQIHQQKIQLPKKQSIHTPIGQIQSNSDIQDVKENFQTFVLQDNKDQVENSSQIFQRQQSQDQQLFCATVEEQEIQQQQQQLQQQSQQQWQQQSQQLQFNFGQQQANIHQQQYTKKYRINKVCKANKYQQQEVKQILPQKNYRHLQSLPEANQVFTYGICDQYAQRQNLQVKPFFKLQIRGVSQFQYKNRRKWIQPEVDYHQNNNSQVQLSTSLQYKTPSWLHTDYLSQSKKFMQKSQSCDIQNQFTQDYSRKNNSSRGQKTSKSLDIISHRQVAYSLANIADFNCYSSSQLGQPQIRFQQHQQFQQQGLFGLTGYGHHLFIQNFNIFNGDQSEFTLSQPQQIYVSSKTTTLNWRPQLQEQCCVGDTDGCFRIIDLEKLDFLVDIECHQRRILSISESEFYRNLFITVGSEGIAKLWQGHPNDTLMHFTTKFEYYFQDAKFSPDNQNVLAISSIDGKIFFYDLRSSQQPYQVLQRNTQPVKQLKFLNQQKLVTSSLDQCICSWSTHNNIQSSSQNVQDSLKKYQYDRLSCRTHKDHLYNNNYYDIDAVYSKNFICTGSANNRIYIYNTKWDKSIAQCEFKGQQQETAKMQDSKNSNYGNEIYNNQTISVQFLPESYNLIDPIVFAVNDRGWLNVYQLQTLGQIYK